MGVGLTVPTEGDLIVRAARDVVEGGAGDLGAGHLFKFDEVRKFEAHGALSLPTRY